MTVVLDTNVLVASLVANGLCREVVHRAIRLRLLATSDALLDELERTLQEKFAITPSAEDFLRQLRAGVRVAAPQALSTPVCRHATDDMVLATAIGAGADLIVTGDQDLLALGSYQGVRILSPRSCLERLDRGV